jgi:hypothetical protein
MEFRNGILLQLVECIESSQNEVKRKMIEAGACNAVPKSHARASLAKKFTKPHNSLSAFLASCRVWTGACLKWKRRRMAPMMARRANPDETFRDL